MAKQPELSSDAPATIPIRPGVATASASQQTPLISMRPTELSPQSQTFLDLTMRRMREILVDAQKRLAKGRIVVDVFIDEGTLTGEFHLRPDWIERLGRR